jgi:hypothetical protein
VNDTEAPGDSPVVAGGNPTDACRGTPGEDGTGATPDVASGVTTVDWIGCWNPSCITYPGEGSGVISCARLDDTCIGGTKIGNEETIGALIISVTILFPGMRRTSER